MTCASCGAVAPSGWKYCPGCLERLVAQSRAGHSRNCGHVMALTDDRCEWCFKHWESGRDLNRGIPSERRVGKALMVCLVCGFRVKENFDHCPGCGLNPFPSKRDNLQAKLAPWVAAVIVLFVLLFLQRNC